jgi:hypothetical protein
MTWEVKFTRVTRWTNARQTRVQVLHYSAMALFMSSFVKEPVVLYYRSLSMTSSDSPRDLLTAPLRKYFRELTGNIVQVLIVTPSPSTTLAFSTRTYIPAAPVLLLFIWRLQLRVTMLDSAATDCQSHFVLIVNGSNDGMPSRLYKDGQPVALSNPEALSTVTSSVRSPASSSCVSTLGVNSIDDGPAWRGSLTSPSSGSYSRDSPKGINLAATYDVRSPAIVLAERYIQRHQLQVDQQMADYDMRMELRDIDDWNRGRVQALQNAYKNASWSMIGEIRLGKGDQESDHSLLCSDEEALRMLRSVGMYFTST